MAPYIGSMACGLIPEILTVAQILWTSHRPPSQEIYQRLSLMVEIPHGCQNYSPEPALLFEELLFRFHVSSAAFSFRALCQLPDEKADPAPLVAGPKRGVHVSSCQNSCIDCPRVFLLALNMAPIHANYKPHSKQGPIEQAPQEANGPTKRAYKKTLGDCSPCESCPLTP